jgi:hypothetical protein
MPATYEPIATTTLGSAASNITFSSIPATYTDLKVVITGTSSASEYVAVQFNGDTSTNYSRTALFGDGSTVTSNQTTSGNYVRDDALFTNNTNVAMTSFDVFSYAGSTFKTLLMQGSGDKNGSGIVSRIVGLWRSTSAITSIKLYGAFGANFNTGTTATLYGIKNA